VTTEGVADGVGVTLGVVVAEGVGATVGIRNPGRMDTKPSTVTVTV
jgi:hypothetical protein